jgi:HEAT repeat protein
VALLLRGLGDGDAGVRAACARASGREDPRAASAALMRRLHELAGDRDRSVRADAIATLGALEPGHRARRPSDPAAEVRVASLVGAAEPVVRSLAADRDPAVRAAALRALGDRAPELAGAAASDLSAAVRAAAVAIADEATLQRLAGDAAPEVANLALAALVGRRGRQATIAPLLATFAAVSDAERVRIARAWLLAR